MVPVVLFGGILFFLLLSDGYVKYLILQSQKKGGSSVSGEVIAGGDEFLLNISLINVDVSYVISATKIEPITFSNKILKRF